MGDPHEGMEVKAARGRVGENRIWLRYVALRTTPHNLDKPEALARLVAEEVAAEREECAKICEEIADEEEDSGNGDVVPLGIARAIRARSAQSKSKKAARPRRKK